MGKIEAVIFDVDGTLYDYREGKIHNSTVEAINYLKEKGIIIVIASARSYSELSEDCIRRVAADYYIGASGHCIQDCQGRSIFEDRFTYAQTEFVKELAIKYDAGLCLKYANYTCLYRKPTEMHAIFSNIGTPKCPSVISNCMNHHEEELPVGFTLYGEAREQIRAEVEQRSDEFRMELFRNGIVGEIYGANINKMTAVTYLMSRLGIAKENCVAFGDGGNDVEMIKWAGIGVAMANGHDCLKDVADYVCGNGWEDGISKFIYLLDL